MASLVPGWEKAASGMVGSTQGLGWAEVSLAGAVAEWVLEMGLQSMLKLQSISSPQNGRTGNIAQGIDTRKNRRF